MVVGCICNHAQAVNMCMQAHVNIVTPVETKGWFTSVVTGYYGLI